MSVIKSYAAVDLGASSGRVMVGRVGSDTLELTEAHRFVNRPVRVPEGLRWDVLSLYAGVLDGLRAAGQVDSVGIDSWAVDYGLLDRDGALLGNPVHYRDARTEGVAEKVWASVPAAELYAATGLQYAPFNTLYQLTAARGTRQLAAAERLLLIPDLLTYWLTGEAGTELTNASTTQLIDPRTRDWAHDIARKLDIDLGLFAPLRQPGDPAGVLRAEVLEETGLTGPVPVTTVGSHDTASAVAAVPAVDERFAYICTGTWSLAGLELDAPVLSEESRAANFTNELGLDGTVRYLRNIMGLWLLQECVRAWGTPSWVRCCGPRPRYRGCGPWWMRVTRRFWRRGGCRSGSPRPAGSPGSRCPNRRARSRGASSTPSPSRIGGRWPTPSGSPGMPSTSYTSSGVGRATRCCANSPPMPAGCRWWRVRPRPPRSAMSSSRAGPTGSSATVRTCAGCSPVPSR